MEIDRLDALIAPVAFLTAFSQVALGNAEHLTGSYQGLGDVMAGRSAASTRAPGPWRPGPPPRGNTWSLIHGAESERAVAKRAEQVHAELLTIAPYLDEDKFIPAVRRYLAAAARESLLDDHIQRVSAEKGPGAVASRTWEQCTAAARLADKLAAGLGLTVEGHARIRALSAGAASAEEGLAELLERGRAARARAGQLLEGEESD